MRDRPGRLMWMEMMQQPQVAAGLLEGARAEVTALARRLRRRPPAGIVFAARGTSDNAALYGKYLIETYLGVPVSLAAPSIITLYGRSLDVRGWLVVGLSQSGQSTDIVEFVRRCRARGAVTVAVTNDAASPLAGAAHTVIEMRAGAERSVAATKTYTAQLTALAMLVGAWSGHHALRALDEIPDAIARTLHTEPMIMDIASRWRALDDCIVTGRGYNYATAYEAALKLKEVSYVAAEALSAADLLHGPIAVVERGFPVILFALRGRTYAFLCDIARRLRRQSADLLVVADDARALRSASVGLRLPADVPESLSPIPAIVPAQLLAYHLALRKGTDPDRPRGLRKVTKTL